MNYNKIIKLNNIIFDVIWYI